MSTAVLVCADARTIALRALDLLIWQLGEAVVHRGEAHLALTGGSTAAALYEVLRDEPRAARVSWPSVHVWQGDERFVPPEHPDLNWSQASGEWLEHPDGPPVPLDQRHPIPVAEAIAAGDGPEVAAGRYGALVERLLPRRAGRPAFDAILLGVGNDGHILSAFPHGAALDPGRELAMAVPAPSHIAPAVPRVTLVPLLLGSARLVVVMAAGAGKAAIIADVLGPQQDLRRRPAQLAVRPNAVWLLDRSSAAMVAGASKRLPSEDDAG